MAPFFSVIVPVHNGGAAFVACLDALIRSHWTDFELIVADDGSQDGSGEVAARFGARVVETGGREGPAAARNLGARAAAGEVLLFVDADCAIHRDTLGKVRELLTSDPGLAAVFGSYDDTPAARGFVAQYKNLLHHFVHHQGSAEASTFWAGCGAVRRQIFLDLGGFDAERYGRPSIEDIELGYRLRAAGHRILLAPEVQVTHYKAWTLPALLRSDLHDRAVPWTRLILERRGLINDLNLDWKSRASAAAAWGLVLCAALAFIDLRFLGGAGAAALFLAAANHRLYRFFARKRGLLFTAAAVPLHWLYFLYSAVAFAWAAAAHTVGRRRRRHRVTDAERRP